MGLEGPNFASVNLGAFRVNQGAATGGWQKEFDHLFFVFGILSLTFWSLFLMLLSLFSSLFCQTPFAGLLWRQRE